MRWKIAFVVGLLSVPLVAQGWVDRTGPNGPSPRHSHGMCYDPVRGYVLLSGGVSNTSPGLQQDTWSWDGTNWTPRGTAPTCFTCLAVHGATNKVLGLAPSGASPYTGLQAYEWNGSQWSSAGTLTNVWTSWNPAPSSRLAAAYDAVRQEVIVSPDENGIAAQAVAVFDGNTWSARICTTPLPATTAAVGGQSAVRSVAWDPVNARIVAAQDESSLVQIFGTWLNMPCVRFYEWNGFGWNLRMPPAWPGISGATATDTVHQRVILLDGEQPQMGGPGSNQPNHTWTYANGICTRLSSLPSAPAPRAHGRMVFDTARGLCVLFGGLYQNLPMGDTWEFDLGPLATFSTYGSGCIGSRGVPTISAQGTSTPRIGTSFQVHVDNLPWTGPAIMLVGVSDTFYASTALPFDLGLLGAPGCSLLTSIELIDVLNNVLGTAIWTFQVPPVHGASFYTQVLPLDPGINALGMTASNGGHGVIGL